MHRAILPGYDSLAELERLHRSGMRVDAVDEAGLTCLWVAAAAGEDAAVAWLLDHGADPSIVNREDGRSPLHAASASGHVAVVARLLNAGAISTRRDDSGKTPAEVGHAAKHLEVVRTFLEHSRDEQRRAARRR